MFKNKFFLALCFILFLFSALKPSLLTSESARDILDSSRTLGTSFASIALLEKNLPGSGELRPYYLLELARLCAVTADWEKALEWSRSQEISTLPKPIADEVVYWYGQALLKNGQTEKALALYQKQLDSGLVSEPLLFLAYLRIAPSGAEKIITRFDSTFPTIKETDRETFALSRYLGGLVAIRSGDWKFAQQSLSRFSPAYDSLLPETAPWSHYYLAYSLYRLGRWSESVKEYSLYLDTWKNHAFSWQAATSASFAALQAGVDALPFAERAVRLAPSRVELAESVLLQSSLLIDKKRYTEAELLLLGIADGSATKGRTPSTPRALFMLTETAVLQRNPSLAEERALALVTQFPKDPLAEEALYRSAEQWYINGDWARSSSLFERYRKNATNVRFLDIVLWFGGDAYNRSGNADLAILWWQEAVKKYPQSSLVPLVYRELISALRIKGEYNSAKVTAEQYLLQFPLEAKRDEAVTEIEELTKLSLGESADITSLYTSYVQLKRANTAEGRTLGVRLARQYLTDYSKRDGAKEILREITAKSPRSPEGLSLQERNTFASAWSMLGNLYRENSDQKAASPALLTAGTWFAPIDGERAAECLYGAVDSFILSGLIQDAQTCFSTLTKNWPDSVWTHRASLLLSRQTKE